jgi:hypothetical protein
VLCRIVASSIKVIAGYFVGCRFDLPGFNRAFTVVLQAHRSGGQSISETSFIFKASIQMLLWHLAKACYLVKHKDEPEK